MTTLKLKRAYAPASEQDGWRVYVDRLWPRGLSHRTFVYDVWDKQIAPSTSLRQWFHQDPEGRWEGFLQKYSAELLGNPAFAQLAEELSGHEVVTLLFSSHDSEHDNAVVVRNVLLQNYGSSFRAGQGQT